MRPIIPRVYPGSFYGNGFCQVSWLIHIRAARDSHEVTKELQWYGAKNALQSIVVDAGNFYEINT
jgi:hypothetical protein